MGCFVYLLFHATLLPAFAIDHHMDVSLLTNEPSAHEGQGQLCKDLQVLLHAQIRVQGVFLLADADTGTDLPPVGLDVKTKDFRASRRDRRESINHPNNGRLPRTIGTQEAVAFSLPDLEIDPVHCDHVSVLLIQSICFYD
jgi:hypothetical protein